MGVLGSVFVFKGFLFSLELFFGISFLKISIGVWSIEESWWGWGRLGKALYSS